MSTQPNPDIVALVKALDELKLKIEKLQNLDLNFAEQGIWYFPPMSLREMLYSILYNINLIKKYQNVVLQKSEIELIKTAQIKINIYINQCVQFFDSLYYNSNNASYQSLLNSIPLFVIWIDKNIISIFQEYEKQQAQNQLNTNINKLSKDFQAKTTQFQEQLTEGLTKGIAAEWEKADHNVLPKKLRTNLKNAKKDIDELVPDIQALKTSVQEQIDELIPNKDELKEKIRLINEAKETADELPQNLDTLKDAQTKVAQYKQTVEEDHKTIADLKAKIEDLHNALSDTQTRHAQELAAQKAAFTKQNEEHFEAIKQHFITERETIAKEKADFDAHTKAQQIEIDNLLKKAEETLGISTTVSLSKAFNDKAAELKKTIFGWVVALFVVLFLGVILSYCRFNDLLSALGQNPQWGVITMHAVIAVLSLGAPLWFSWLATKQISQRFRLAEDYAFKASVALAYEGYKREAEKLGDDNALKQRLFDAALTRLEESPIRLLETQKPDNGNMPWLTMSDVKDLWKKFPDIANKLFTEIRAAKDLLAGNKSNDKSDPPKADDKKA